MFPWLCSCVNEANRLNSLHRHSPRVQTTMALEAGLPRSGFVLWPTATVDRTRLAILIWAFASRQLVLVRLPLMNFRH
jgi:hypothetical protein